MAYCPFLLTYPFPPAILTCASALPPPFCTKTEQGEELAAKWGVPFFETSAKDSINIEEAFMAVAESVWHVRHAEDSNNPCECVLL